jgi:hypothetical protein
VLQWILVSELGAAFNMVRKTDSSEYSRGHCYHQQPGSVCALGQYQLLPCHTYTRGRRRAVCDHVTAVRASGMPCFCRCPPEHVHAVVHVTSGLYMDHARPFSGGMQCGTTHALRLRNCKQHAAYAQCMRGTHQRRPGQPLEIRPTAFESTSSDDHACRRVTSLQLLQEKTSKYVRVRTATT